MENVLFKISYPAEFHAQTAVDAAHQVYAKLKTLGKTSDDIKSVRIRTQEAAIRCVSPRLPDENFDNSFYSTYCLGSSTNLGLWTTLPIESECCLSVLAAICSPDSLSL
jgi:2-methylcitrate dehydratase PrpD